MKSYAACRESLIWRSGTDLMTIHLEKQIKESTPRGRKLLARLFLATKKLIDVEQVIHQAVNVLINCFVKGPLE